MPPPSQAMSAPLPRSTMNKLAWLCYEQRMGTDCISEIADLLELPIETVEEIFSYFKEADVSRTSSAIAEPAATLLPPQYE